MINQNKGTISLITIFSIGFLALAMVLTSSLGVLAELSKNRNTVLGDRSFYAAESSVREGIYQYIKYGFEGIDTFPMMINEIPESDIHFEISSSHKGWMYKDIEGKAQNKSNFRKVKNALLLSPSSAAFEYAIYSENEINFYGAAGLYLKGNMFSNNNINCNGNVVVEGNLSSHNLVSDECAVSDEETYAISSNSQYISYPEINIDYYREIATCTSTLSNLQKDCLKKNQETSGVIFVDDPDGSAVLTNAKLTGNLTVIGNLTLGANNVIRASDDYFALIVNGDLTTTGNTEIYGVVYVTGTTNFSVGKPSIYGSIISVGGAQTDIGGSVEIDYIPLSNMPKGFIMSGGPIISNWQEE